MDLAEMIRKQEELEEAYHKEGGRIITEYLKRFFDKYSEAHIIRWTQYTPYFNDGDPCVFGTCLDAILTEREFQAMEDSGSSYYEEFSETFPYDSKAYKEFSQFLNDAEKVLEAALGDHKEVIATRDNLEVEDYDHE